MPRQPLLPTHQFASYGIDPWDFDKMPKVAELVGRCIMCWSHVQFQIGILLSSMMGANSEASVAIFLSLQNARARRDVLFAAAKACLKEDDLDLFEAFMTVYQSLDAQRADLAHGLFSQSDDMPDAAMWVSAQDEAKHTVALLLNMQRKRMPPGYKSPKEHTFFYTTKDLETLQGQMFEFWRASMAFSVYLREGKKPGTLGAAQFQMLCASPQIQQEVARRRSYRQASQS
jgi:hypothetical protein